MATKSQGWTLRKILIATPKEKQEKVLSQILSQVLKIANEVERARLLVDLAPFLSKPLLQATIEAIRAIANTEQRAQLLVSLVPSLSQPLLRFALKEALESVLRIDDLLKRARLLAVLAPCLPKSSRADALEMERVILQNLPPSEERARLLLDFLPNLPEAVRMQTLENVLDSVRMLANVEERARLLQVLLPLLPEAVQEQDIADILTYEIKQMHNERIAENTQTLSIRITEHPLTAQNVTAIVWALIDLHTKCWLIQQHRFSDLMDYAQTRDTQFVKEANLCIGKITYNSPALIDFLVSSASIAGTATLALALKTAIDAIAQTPLRFRAAQLNNHREELEQQIRAQESQQTLKIEAQKADTENKAALQDQELTARKAQADLERQMALLDLTKQQVEVEKQQVELEKQRLLFEKDRVKVVLEIAKTMISQLQPDLEVSTKEMLMHTLVPSLLQLATSEGLELALPEPQKDDNAEKPSNHE